MPAARDLPFSRAEALPTEATHVYFLYRSIGVTSVGADADRLVGGIPHDWEAWLLVPLDPTTRTRPSSVCGNIEDDVSPD